MLATSLYVETKETNNASNHHLEDIQENSYDSNSNKVTDDLVELDLDSVESETSTRKGSRTTTDLVRLYLQEIGRVPLLERDEEVSEAQKVQRHIHIIEQRAEAAEQGDTVLAEFVDLINIHDRLVTQLSHRPSLRRWSKTAGLEITELKEILARGKKRWAELIGCNIKELEKIQRDGIRAKEHMIKAILRLVVSVSKKIPKSCSRITRSHSRGNFRVRKSRRKM